MKSSSALFPVSLLKAELHDELTEDIYLVKHNLDDDTTVEIALTRLGKLGQSHSGQPVILVHGSFSNRSFWTSPKQSRLGNYLLQQGYDVWIMEHRGHGFSPYNRDFQNNSMSRYVEYDLPAIQQFVVEQTQESPVWMGHSLGGQMIASAIAAQVFTQPPKAIVLAGTRFFGRPKYLWMPGVGLLLKAWIKFKNGLDGRKIGIGPEEEPAGILTEYFSRLDWFGRWRTKNTPANKMKANWQTASVPLLGISASKDKRDPAKYCHRLLQSYGGPLTDVELGTKSGFSRDYGHVSMLVGESARDEVYPLISAWLDDMIASQRINDEPDNNCGSNIGRDGNNEGSNDSSNDTNYEVSGST